MKKQKRWFSLRKWRTNNLEVEDLSGPTFIRSLRRFTARRGTPSLINSDNAKTLKFTANILKKLENDILSLFAGKKDNMEIQLRKKSVVGRLFREDDRVCEEVFTQSSW